MADPFVAEIRMFAGNFAPRGWAFCDGQLLPLSQNTALFSLVGTTYGGNGETNFALPDLRGATPLHPGQGPGLSSRSLGEAGGQASVALDVAEIPAHGHPALIGTGNATTGTPSATAAPGVAATSIYGTQNLMPMGDLAGGGQPHNNRQPFLGLTFIIALQGVFPPRS